MCSAALWVASEVVALELLGVAAQLAIARWIVVSIIITASTWHWANLCIAGQTSVGTIT